MKITPTKQLFSRCNESIYEFGPLLSLSRFSAHLQVSSGSSFLYQMDSLITCQLIWQVECYCAIITMSLIKLSTQLVFTICLGNFAATNCSAATFFLGIMARRPFAWGKICRLEYNSGLLLYGYLDRQKELGNSRKTKEDCYCTCKLA